MKTSPSLRNRAGFTLVELVVSIAILAIMSLVISQMLSSTAQITVVNTKRADANSQARMVFDRMETDFARMVKRSDVDYIFYKAVGSGTNGANDTMFFYSEAASYFPSLTTFFTAAPYKTTPYAYKDSVSLVGYRINNNTASADFAAMERLGRPLTWDNAPAYNGQLVAYPAAVVFLTYPASPATTAQLSSTSSPFCANPATGTAYSTAIFNSTLAGAFSNEGAAPTLVGTKAGNFNDGGTTSDAFDPPFYRLIGSQVFRFEYSFQLRDGTESGIPVMNAATASDPNNVPTSNLTATSPPAASNDSTAGGGGYAAGSRWYDTMNQIGYICLDASPNAAVWHEIGLQDISAIVVTIAVMDNQGLILLKKKGTLNTVMPTLEAQLADGTSSAVAQTWQTALTPVSGTGVSPVATATGIPQAIISQIRVYQRYFYVNNL
jgi:prepilin-type N-terminal cleavage/methylation domain-containing protein